MAGQGGGHQAVPRARARSVGRMTFMGAFCSENRPVRKRWMWRAAGRQLRRVARGACQGGADVRILRGGSVGYLWRRGHLSSPLAAQTSFPGDRCGAQANVKHSAETGTAASTDAAWRSARRGPSHRRARSCHRSGSASAALPAVRRQASSRASSTHFTAAYVCIGSGRKCHQHRPCGDQSERRSGRDEIRTPHFSLRLVGSRQGSGQAIRRLKVPVHLPNSPSPVRRRRWLRSACSSTWLLSVSPGSLCCPAKSASRCEPDGKGLAAPRAIGKAAHHFWQ